MQPYFAKISAILILLAVLVSCVPSNIPPGAREVNFNGSTAYVFDASGSSLLPDVRINWGAKRIEGEGLNRAREADLRNAPFTCPEAEAFLWMRGLGASDTNIVMPDFRLQLENKGYSINAQPSRQSGSSSFLYQVVSKGEQIFFLTWIWTPSSNPTSVSVDVCKVKMKPNAPPLQNIWLPRAPSTFQ